MTEEIELTTLIEGLPEGAKLKLIDIEEAADDPRNANMGTEEGELFLDASIAAHGAGRSVLLDKDNTLIAGNKSRNAAQVNGIKKMLVVSLPDGNTMVGVQRQDLDLEDDSTGARLLAYRDNRSGQLNLHWDDAIIAADAENDELGLDEIFSVPELQAFKQTGYRPPSLEEMEEEYGEPGDRDFWPIARVQVHPRTYKRFVDLMEQMEGEDEAEQFEALLDMVPIETPAYEEDEGEEE
jgi:hypothetical protein